MRFRRKSALEAPDEAAKLRHDLRLRWLDEAERTQSQAATLEPEPSEYDPDYRSRRPYIGKEPQTVTADMWSPWITDAAMTRMAKAIINPPPDPDYTPQERTTMNDEIKVGDTVGHPLSSGLYRVLATFGDWLWLETPDGSPVTQRSDGWRKVKTPTPCPERWGNIYPDYAVWFPTRERAEQGDVFARPDRIGVLHLSPNGDCEFIRTEETE